MKSLLPIFLFILSAPFLMAQQVNLIQDINPGEQDGRPDRFIEYNGQLIFRATTEDSGAELWISDGTEDGTRLLKDINPDSDFSAGNSNPGNFIEFDGRVFFSARAPGSGTELWVTDGTEDGTQLFKDIQEGEDNGAPRDFVIFQGQLWFTATTEAESSELWVSDGTEAGTELFLDINPGSGVGNPNFKYVTTEGGLMFFNARTPDAGTELWLSDGTVVGTQLLKDIDPGSGNSFPSRFTSVGNTVFFRAADSLGRELWKTDGTEAGTQLAIDFREGEENSNPDNLIQIGIAGVAPPVLFCTADPDGEGDRLYVIEPSSNNFNEWANLNQGNSMEPDDILPHFGFLFTFTSFFTQENDQGGIDTIGRELFLADPFGLVLDQGNIELLSFTPDNLDPDHDDFVYDFLEDFLYYTKETTEGQEVYRVPLAANFQSEVQVSNIRPGAESASARELIILGKDVYFQADDGMNGRELYGFIAEKGDFAISELPGLSQVEAGDTLDLGLVEQSFDTTLLFEIETLASPIIEFTDVEVIGDGFSSDAITPALLIQGGRPGDALFDKDPLNGRDTFNIYYSAAEEGQTDVGTVTVRANFTENERYTFFIKAEVEEIVSAPDAFARNWQLAPNPVSSTAQLTGQSLESDGQIDIIDNQGRIINSYPIRKYQSNRKLILGQLQKGTYYLRLSAPNHKATTIPFIKQ